MTELTKKQKNTLRQEFRKRIIGYIVAAFGLIAGLAWNEAIKALIEYLFPMDKNSLTAKFSYAVLITIVVVVVTVYLSRIFIGEENKEK